MSQVLISGDGIEMPQKVLFPPERINLKWTQVHRIGAGLQNMGNTCFLNSALQCLTYSAPFTNYMLTREHSKTCELMFNLFPELYDNNHYCMITSSLNFVSSGPQGLRTLSVVVALSFQLRENLSSILHVKFICKLQECLFSVNPSCYPCRS